MRETTPPCPLAPPSNSMWWVAGINPDGSPQLVNVVGLLCGALLLALLLGWALCAMLFGRLRALWFSFWACWRSV